MADVSVQNERINGWIPSSATNVILNWPERIKTQPHDDRDHCFLPFDSKGPCGMTVNNDIDDDSATKHGDSHTLSGSRVAREWLSVARAHTFLDTDNSMNTNTTKSTCTNTHHTNTNTNTTPQRQRKATRARVRGPWQFRCSAKCWHQANRPGVPLRTAHHFE